VMVEEKKNIAPLKDEPAGPTVPLTESTRDAVWTKVLSEVGFTIAGVLKKASSLAIPGPNALVMRVSQRYNVPGGAILDSTQLARVEDVLHKITGQPCNVRVEFIKDEEPAADAGRSAVAPPTAQARQQRAEILQMPLVKKAVEVLGAQLVRADEGFGAPAVPVPDTAEDE
jgi:hypothetical protein